MFFQVLSNMDEGIMFLFIGHTNKSNLMSTESVMIAVITKIYLSNNDQGESE